MIMRTKPILPRLLRLSSWLLLAGCAAPLSAQTYTQTINLNPGWNSVFLEVTPANTKIGRAHV